MSKFPPERWQECKLQEGRWTGQVLPLLMCSPQARLRATVLPYQYCVSFGVMASAQSTCQVQHKGPRWGSTDVENTTAQNGCHRVENTQPLGTRTDPLMGHSMILQKPPLPFYWNGQPIGHYDIGQELLFCTLSVKFRLNAESKNALQSIRINAYIFECETLR